jgi:hypothetical protein
MNIISKRSIDRRTVLRGIGTALSLPLLDSMFPALSAYDKAAAKPVNRFGAVYVPNGIIMQHWTPDAEGTGFELPPILKPLEPFRNRLLVLSGLNCIPPPNAVENSHPKASTRFLTDVAPKATGGTSDLHAGISMDQIAAKQLGKNTQLASLELGLESSESAGTCSSGFSCAYTSTISWSSPTTPLPMEYDPRAVFERMFGDSRSTDADVRRARMRKQGSILDYVAQKTARLEREVGAGDRAKLVEYFEAIRDVERRMQKAEEQSPEELPTLDHPAGVPAKFEDHANLMYDLMALAYQCDMTRIITFMIGREQSGRTFPDLGIPDGHHPLTHQQTDPLNLAKLVKINTYHVTLFTRFLQKLRSMPDGDGTVLDHITMIYGSGMSDGQTHDPLNLPILVVGGGFGQLKGGAHIRYPKDTPLANLHLTLLDKLGVRIESIGDSTGEFNQLSVNA